jgi:hypothetical protein
MKEDLEEGPEFGHIHLHKAIADLPTHEPGEHTWAHIVQQLDFATALDNARQELPEHEPNEMVWDCIMVRLDQEEPTASVPVPPVSAPIVRRMWPTKQLWRVSALAASWLLVLLAWHYWPSATPVRIVAQEHISYSEETLPTSLAAQEPLPLPNDAAEEHEGMAFINAQCTKVPVGCQTPEFQTLKKQMLELDAEEKRLQQEVRRFGNNPELVRYQTRVTTMKATVTKELIQLLIS